MNFIFDFIEWINFKKVVIIYIVLSVTLLLSCFAVALYWTRDLLNISIEYSKIIDEIKKVGITEKIKEKLIGISNRHDSLVNALIADKNGEIKFSINKNIIGDNNQFILLNYGVSNRLFQLDYDNNHIFKPLKNESILYLNRLFVDEYGVGDFGKGKNHIHEEKLATKNILLLNYIIDYKTGERVYIIRKTKKMPYVEAIFDLIDTILEIIFVLYWIGIAIWVYRDAKEKGTSAVLWGLLVLFTNLIGVIIYNLVKQSYRICYSCKAMQNPDNIFCVSCGTLLNNSCHKCHHVALENHNYCAKCGEKINRYNIPKKLD